jgi:acyl-CoA thioester hydrolase
MSSEAIKGAVIAKGTVLPEWIDANNHMNVAWYVLAFDLGVDGLWNQFGITEDYVQETRGSTFAVECHITYQRELLEGDPYIVTGQILAFDEKRIHQFQRLYHAEKNYLAATAEWMNLHVDLDSRRVSPWPASILANIDRFSRSQGELSLPKESCSHMQVRKPLYSIYREQA